MTISQAETGLTNEQYTLLQSDQDSPTKQIMLQRWNFDFTSFNLNGLGSSEGNDFDVIAFGSKIIRVVNGGHVDVYDGSWSTNTIADYPSDALDRPSLVVDEDDLILYVITPTSIEVTKTSDGSTWDSWTTALTFTGQTGWNAAIRISAVKKGQVFWTICDPALRSVSIHWTETDSGLTLVDHQSEIYLSVMPRSITTGNISTSGDTTRAMVILAMDTPGRTREKVVDNKFVKHVERAGGMLAFHLINGVMSDHFDVDLLDQQTTWRYRESPCLSQINGKFFLIAAAGDGSNAYHFTRYRFYTSKDGKLWSNGFILPGLNANAASGLKLIALGDEVYVMNRRQTWQSPSVLLNDNSTVEYDITLRVLDYQNTVSEMQQSSLLLSNEDGFFDDKQLPDVTWAITQKWGYKGVNQQVAIQQVDNIKPIETLEGTDYRKAVQITCRDHLMWMTDEVQSEQPKYWQTQLVGGDHFNDQTSTGYGGLSHTDPFSGSFKSRDDTLLLVSNSEEGIAASTLASGNTDMWNGSFEIGFRLSKASDNEYAGATFRMSDKDNLWYVAYFQSEDKIKLVQRISGADLPWLTTSTLGWTSDILAEFRYVKVNFRYSQVSVETSEDAITWTHLLTFIQSAWGGVAGDVVPITQRPVERGFVGVIGKGYSTLDEWEGDSSWIDIGDVLTGDNEESRTVHTYAVNTEKPDFLIFLSGDCRIILSELDYGGTSMVHALVDPPTPFKDAITNSGGVRVGAYHMIYDPFDPNRIIIFGAGGWGWVDDVWGTPAFTFCDLSADPSLIPADGYLASGTAGFVDNGAPIVGSPSRRGYFAWGSGGYFYFTTDYGTTITRKLIGSNITSIAIGPYNSQGRGEIEISVGSNVGDVPGMYKSLDWGMTWKRAFFVSASELGNIIPSYWHYAHIPTTLEEGVPNVQHQSLWGTYSYVGLVSCSSVLYGMEYIFGYNLWIDPYNDRLIDLNPTVGGIAHKWAHSGGARNHYCNPADGRYQASIYTMSQDFLCLDNGKKLVQIGMTDNHDGTFSNVVQGNTDGKAYTLWNVNAVGDAYNPLQLMGFITNPLWMVNIGRTVSASDKVFITEDGWQSHTDWTTANASAKTTAGITGYINASILPDIRSVATVPDDLDYDEEFGFDDWLDDDFGLPLFNIEPEHCIAFGRLRVYDNAQPQVVEDAVKVYSNYSGIHDFKFKNTYITDGLGWVTADDISFDMSKIILDGTAIHPTTLNHQYLITADISTLTSNGFLLNLRDATLSALDQTHYYVGLDGSDKPIIKKWNAETLVYDTVYHGADAVSNFGYVQICAREMIYGTQQDNLWLNITLWINGTPAASFLEWIKESPETLYYFGLSGTMDLENLRIPQLTEYVEWNSLDPEEYPIGGLQRALEGRYVRFFIRWNGEMYAWKQVPSATSYTFTNHEIEGGIDRQFDYRQRVTHARMVGAYKEAEYVRDDLGTHKFRAFKNPYLMTYGECYNEARLSLQRQEEMMDTVSFMVNYRPCSEVGDKISTSVGFYILDSYQVKPNPAQAQQSISARKYIFGA